MDVDRREMLSWTVGGLLLSGSVQALAQAPDPQAIPRLWYHQPARMWLEALPVGNGRIGAMVPGGIRQEELQLNHDCWWAGRPYDPVSDEARAALPQVRQ